MKTGVSASVDAAGGSDLVRLAQEERRRQAEGEQLALLEEENRELDAKLPLAPPAPEKRGAGRPPGARNKRTQQLAAYYLGRYGDPLEALLALGTGDLAHTHRALVAAREATGLPIGDLTIMQLLAFKRDALVQALPYLHAKLAPTDDKGEAVVPILAIGAVKPGAAEAIAAGGGLNILDLVDVTPAPGQGEQYQRLSGDEAAGSDARGSDDEA